MRVAFLVSGAGGMYCGSCLRDNRLAATLIAQRRDVQLFPLYTPLKTDEPLAADARIFYGGLNVYLQQSLRFFRSARGALDRILDAKPLLRTIGRFASGTRPDDLGPLTVSILRGHDGAQKKELDKLIEALHIIRPDLINLPQLMLLGLAPRLKQALGVPIVCTLGGEDIFLDRLPQPHRDDALRLIADRIPDVDAFIAVTRFYAAHATLRFALPPDRVHYVPMGVTVDAFAPAAPDPHAPFTIGYLARNCSDKGLHVLVDAFIRLRAAGRDCRLRVAGFLAAADRPFFNEIRARIRRNGLDPHVDFVGELDFDAKVRFLQTLHAFSVPAVYPEAKGLSILEALAAGVPVVQPRSGSSPELVESTGGGILVDADEPPNEPSNEFSNEPSNEPSNESSNLGHAPPTPLPYREGQGEGSTEGRHSHHIASSALSSPGSRRTHLIEYAANDPGGPLVSHPNPTALATALANGIARLIDDPALRARLAAAGRSAVAAQFNETQMADKTWDIYERLTGSRIRRTS